MPIRSYIETLAIFLILKPLCGPAYVTSKSKFGPPPTPHTLGIFGGFIFVIKKKKKKKLVLKSKSTKKN
jgi:hypothetical protein